LTQRWRAGLRPAPTHGLLGEAGPQLAERTTMAVAVAPSTERTRTVAPEERSFGWTWAPARRTWVWAVRVKVVPAPPSRGVTETLLSVTLSTLPTRMLLPGYAVSRRWSWARASGGNLPCWKASWSSGGR